MRFFKLIDSHIEPVFLISSNGEIEYVNHAFQEFMGHTSAFYIGKKIWSALDIPNPEKLKESLKNLCAQTPEAELSTVVAISGSQKLPLKIVLFGEIQNDKIVHISGKIVKENTDSHRSLLHQKDYAISLYDVEQKYKTIFNLTFEGIIIHTAGIIIETNPAFESMMGYNKDELIGQDIVALCVLPAYQGIVKAAMINITNPPYEVQVKRKDGTLIYTKVESREIVLNHQKLRVSAIRDITERKIAAIKLKESEERYRFLSSLTFEGIILHEKGLLIEVNQSFVDLLGYSSEELIGKNINDLAVLPKYQPQVIKAQLEGEIKPYEIEARRKDGSTLFVELESRVIHHQGKKLRVTAVRDISWRKETERKLRENQEELDLFFSKSGDAFFIMKLDEPLFWNNQIDKNQAFEIIYKKMYITKVNDAMIGHYGMRLGDLDGLTPEDFFSWDEAFGRQFTWSLIDQGNATFENYEPRNDGSYMWVEGNYVVLYDDKGRVRGACGVRRDVTERKLAEQEIKTHNRELKKANEELDNFVYRVSHDLKAPISSAKGLIHIAKMEKEQEDVAQCLDMIEKSMNRLDSFILDILDYSRNSRSHIEASLIDFDALLNDVLAGTRYLQDEKHIRIDRNIRNCIPFYTDRRRLTFIFNNLISNAIRFSDTDKKQSYLEITVKVTNNKAVIHFSDNGIGIAPEHLDHIFEMFYRATETQAGSGLGLYIVKEAIEKLNGSIKVKSVECKGTTFELILPNHNQQSGILDKQLKA